MMQQELALAVANEDQFYIYDAQVVLGGEDLHFDWPLKLRKPLAKGSDVKRLLDEQDLKLSRRLKFDDLLSSKLTKVTREEYNKKSIVPAHVAPYHDDIPIIPD